MVVALERQRLLVVYVAGIGVPVGEGELGNVGLARAAARAQARCPLPRDDLAALLRLQDLGSQLDLADDPLHRRGRPAAAVPARLAPVAVQRPVLDCNSDTFKASETEGATNRDGILHSSMLLHMSRPCLAGAAEQLPRNSAVSASEFWPRSPCES